MKILALALLLLLAVPAFAAPPPEGLPDSAQEARAVVLGQEIRCTVCQSETIEESPAPMAHDLRQLVREKIRAGWSDRQILDYLRSRYGDFILLAPPFQPNTWALWLSPAGFFLTGGWLGWRLLARKKGRAG